MKKTTGFDSSFKFSKEQRDILWKAIRAKWGPKKATSLTNSLEHICRILTWREGKGDRKAHRKMLEAMIESFKQTKTYLEMLGAKDQENQPSFLAVLPGPFRGIMDITASKGIPFSSDPVDHVTNFNSRYFSHEIFPSLDALIKTLDYALMVQPAKGGTPKRSPLLFIKLVAYAYRKKLGEEPICGGLFLTLVQELLAIMELPAKDPHAMIRQALKDPG